MTIMEAAYVVYNKYQETSDLLDKIDIYDESAMYDLNSEIQKSKLSMFSESDKENDKAVSESENKYAEKAKAMISKIITAVLDAIEEFRAKLDEVFNNIKKKDVIGKAEELLKKNPLAAKKKMKYEDSSKAVQVYEAALQKLTSITAKVKADIISDYKKFASDISDFEDDVAKKAKDGYTTVTISIGEGIERIKKSSTSFKDTVKAKVLSRKDKEECNKYIAKWQAASEEVSNKAHNLVTCISLKAKIEKERAAAITKQIISMIDGLKSSISESVHNVEESYNEVLNYGNTYEESTVDTSNYVEGLDMDNYLDSIYKEACSYDPLFEDDILSDVDFFSESLERNDIYGDYYNEGVNTDVFMRYLNCHSKIKKNCKEANAHLKKQEFTAARKSIKEAQKLNNKALKDIETMADVDSSGFSTVIGILLRCINIWFKLFLVGLVEGGFVGYKTAKVFRDPTVANMISLEKLAIPAALTDTAGKIFFIIKDSIKIMRNIKEKAENEEELTAGDFNTFINMYKQLLKNNNKYFNNYYKTIDKKEKIYIDKENKKKDKITKESANAYLDNLIATLNN
jgi:hypothetical protein